MSVRARRSSMKACGMRPAMSSRYLKPLESRSAPTAPCCGLVRTVASARCGCGRKRLAAFQPSRRAARKRECLARPSRECSGSTSTSPGRASRARAARRRPRRSPRRSRPAQCRRPATRAQQRRHLAAAASAQVAAEFLHHRRNQAARPPPPPPAGRCRHLRGCRPGRGARDPPVAAQVPGKVDEPRERRRVVREIDDQVEASPVRSA